MSIFNLEYCHEQLDILNEKKTREEYARRSFKKKHNFVPDKPGGNTGTIEGENGKKYRIDMEKSKTAINDKGVPVKRSTSASLSSAEGRITLDKHFFELKGSNNGERRKAMLNHEIGHQNLHNKNPKSDIVDEKKKSPKLFKTVEKNQYKALGIDLDKNEPQNISTDKNKDNFVTVTDKFRKDLDKSSKEYMNSIKSSKEDQKKRDKSLDAAKKYEIPLPNRHTNTIEFEADRYAANKTSERAIKKGIAETYKNKRKENDKELDKKVHGNKISKEDADDKKKEYNKASEEDKIQRYKALKDNELKDSDIYK